MSVLAMLGMLGAGAISSGAQLYANQQNIKNQVSTNAWSQGLADSAHQREVLDLLKAGLNPVLSASGSGASVPALGAASVVNAGQGIADGISSASNLMSSQYKANVENIRANTDKVNADTSAVRVHSDLVSQQRQNERIRQDILEQERGAGLYDAMNKRLESAAMSEALTGKIPEDVDSIIDWEDHKAVKAYKDLVQKYRNKVELDRYLNSVERQMAIDSVNSANSVKGLRSSKKKGK